MPTITRIEILTFEATDRDCPEQSPSGFAVQWSLPCNDGHSVQARPEYDEDHVPPTLDSLLHRFGN